MLNRADSLVACGKFEEGTGLLLSIVSDYPNEPAATFALHKLVSYRNEKDLQNNEIIYALENRSLLSDLIQKYSDDHPLKVKSLEYAIQT